MGAQYLTFQHIWGVNTLDLLTLTFQNDECHVSHLSFVGTIKSNPSRSCRNTCREYIGSRLVNRRQASIHEGRNRHSSVKEINADGSLGTLADYKPRRLGLNLLLS